MTSISTTKVYRQRRWAAEGRSSWLWRQEIIHGVSFPAKVEKVTAIVGGLTAWVNLSLPS